MDSPVTPPEAPEPLYTLAADDESLEALTGLLEWALPLRIDELECMLDGIEERPGACGS